ncbi:MAG: hypothetical protein U0168_12315 [Nannocystaceae bacterium]|jgi:anti-sigma factor RsiW
MNCEDCRADLLLLLHDELEAVAARAIAEHVRGCDGCAVEYCRMHVDLVAVVQAHAVPPPPRVHAALRAELARRFAPGPWTRALAAVRRPVPAYCLALAAVVPLVLWLGTRPPRDEVTAPAPRPSATEPPRLRAPAPELTDYDGAAAAPIDPTWM